MLAFAAGRLLTPTDVVEHPLVLVEQGRILEISALGERQVPTGVSMSDFGDRWMAPGYVDLHIHGGAGYDVMDATAEALPAIERLKPNPPQCWAFLCCGTPCTRRSKRRWWRAACGR